MIKVEKFYPLMLEAFNEEKTFTFPINGTSMQPLLHTNDLVTLEKITSIKKGDIIFYLRDNGQFVLHRVRKITKDSLIFVGDHQIKLEKNIRFNQCIGKVISYEKVGKGKKNNLNSFRYNLYKYLVRIKLFRFICGKLL